MLTRRRVGTGTLAAPRLAGAQAAWPGERPIEVIVPVPPGGGLDAMARLLMPHVCARIAPSAALRVAGLTSTEPRGAADSSASARATGAPTTVYVS